MTREQAPGRHQPSPPGPLPLGLTFSLLGRVRALESRSQALHWLVTFRTHGLTASASSSVRGLEPRLVWLRTVASGAVAVSAVGAAL